MKTLIMLLLTVAISAYADVRQNTDCYLYELQGENLVLIKKYDKPIIAKETNRAVLILDKGKEPSSEQLGTLKLNIKARYSPPLKEEAYKDTDLDALKEVVKRMAETSKTVLSDNEKELLNMTEK